MKKLILVAALVACLPCGISAAAKPEASFPLAEQPDDYVIQGTMKHMTTQELGRLARTSRRMHDLAQPELAKRKEHAIMMRQRAEFEKHLTWRGTILNFGYRKVTNVEPCVFDVPIFVQLKKLNLDNNQLTNIVPNALDGLEGLEVLDFGYNHLKSISLSNLKNLRKLFLHNNQLTTIPTSVFDDLKELKVLDLRGNPLTEPTKEALRQYFARRPNFKLYL